MSKRFTRSTSKSRSKSPKTLTAPSEDSDEGSTEALISPRGSGKKPKFPKSPDLRRYVQRRMRSRTRSRNLSDEEKKEDQAAGAKSKKSRGTPTTQRRRALSVQTIELREKDLRYLMKETKFPECIIRKWHKLVKDYATSDVKKELYETHRIASVHKDGRLCISSEDACDQIAKVYGTEHWDLPLVFMVNDVVIFVCKSFIYFMKQLNKATDSTNDLDIKLDLMMHMCRDVNDKRGRVHKHKLLAMLKAATHLSLRQEQRVAEDVEKIFDSMKSYMPQPDVLEFVHFRRAIRDGEGRLDVHKHEAKYYVLTCVPEVCAAILAIANRAHRKKHYLPQDTLEVIRHENAFLQRELANKNAESSKAPASTLSSTSLTGASSSGGAHSSPQKKCLARTASNDSQASTDSTASCKSTVSVMRGALKSVSLLSKIP